MTSDDEAKQEAAQDFFGVAPKDDLARTSVDLLEKSKSVVVKTAPEMPKNTGNQQLSVQKTDTQMMVNMPYKSMSVVASGPRDIFNGKPAHGMQNNVLTGHISEHAMSHASFEMALRPNKSTNSKKTAKTRKRIYEQIDLEDPDSHPAETGPWANWENDAEPDIYVPSELELQQAELDRQAEEQAKPVRIEPAKSISQLGGEKSTLHVAALDYQGRTYMHPPADENTTLLNEPSPETAPQSYIPKERLWEFGQGKAHEKAVAAIELFPNSGHMLLSAGMEGKIKLWDVYRNQNLLRSFAGHTKAVKDINFMPSTGQQFLSCAMDGMVKLWDTETGQCVKAFSNGRSPLTVKFHPDQSRNSFLVGMQDKKIIQYDLRSGEITQEYDQHLGPVNTITFVDENRRFISTSDDKTIRAWDYDIPVVIKLVADPQMNSLPAVTLHPTKKWFAAQSLDNQVLVYASDTFKLNSKKRFTGHSCAGFAAGVDFSPDGRFLSSGDSHGDLVFWDYKSGKLLQRLKVDANRKAIIAHKWLPHESVVEIDNSKLEWLPDFMGMMGAKRTGIDLGILLCIITAFRLRQAIKQSIPQTLLWSWNLINFTFKGLDLCNAWGLLPTSPFVYQNYCEKFCSAIGMPSKDAVKKAPYIPRVSGPPAAPGSKEIPVGQDNCLAGLTLVFTGELSSLSREEASELAKRYGGKVTTAPSGKTSFVIVGENAGEKKLSMIRDRKIATLDEDGFLSLIGSRKGVMDEKQLTKLKKEDAEMKANAKAMEEAEKVADRALLKAATGDLPRSQLSSSQLWTTKYAPKALKDICGNKTSVEKIGRWLASWDNSVKSNFKKPGPDMLGCYRAILISGPPGIGKTTSAHLVAKLQGFTPIELNASDVRSKKLLESTANIDNESIDGFFKSKSSRIISDGIEINHKSLLILDEVDGMSGGDRGGVGAINALIKKSRIPIICICNDRSLIKMKPFQSTTFNMTFRKEGLKIPANVVDELIRGAQSDIRQVLTMLSTWRLSNTQMDFDEGKELAKNNEKYTIFSPWQLFEKMSGPYAFSITNRQSLGEKMEYYFQDHSLMPLFVQDNYLKQREFARAKGLVGQELALSNVRLLEKASSAISDGDIVDAMIHQTQSWALMPLHAVNSCVRPCFHTYGQSAGFGGVTFPAWLGQNSKQGKLERSLNEIQIRLRLKVSGDRRDIRQSYLPALFSPLTKPLVKDGNAGIDSVIECMDNYFLGKEEWESVVELGVYPHDGEAVMKSIPTSTKTAFTKKYNATEHPVPYHKDFDGISKGKKIKEDVEAEHEDLMEAADAPVEDILTDNEDNDTQDLTKDRFIKPAKLKKSESLKSSAPKAKKPRLK